MSLDGENRTPDLLVPSQARYHYTTSSRKGSGSRSKHEKEHT